MSFRIVPEVFDKLPELYIGALVVKGIDNTKDYPQVTEFLDECVQNLHRDLAGQKIKEHPFILPFRGAFNALGMNPNKFMPSIEALASRIEKGKGMPHINPIVDLGNAISLKYLLPIGAHPLQALDEECALPGRVTFSAPSAPKRTSSPTWASSSMPTATSSARGAEFGDRATSARLSATPPMSFSPSTGSPSLAPRVEAALDELSALCESFFGCKPVARGAVHKESNEMTF